MQKMLLILVFPLFFAGGDLNKRIEKAILFELNHYPEARLRDIYKNFFQDAFGPGHLIPDTAHAGSYLDYELQQPVGDTLKWQPVGPANDFYRINLSLVKEGIIPRPVMLEAMVESAVLARNPDIETWKKEWQNVMEVIEKMNPDMADFEEDKKAIEALLARDEYVMHHSEHYNTTYSRHYRIIHKSVFSRWKETYLKK
jgi:hypothetical protein